MTHDYNWYIEHGFDEKAALYFSKGRKTIVSVVPNKDHTLRLTFTNGEIRLLDMKPLIMPDTVFEFLQDISNFMRVYLDDTHSVCWDIDPDIDSNVVWRNKVDLCPDTCYMDSIPLNV